MLKIVIILTRSSLTVKIVRIAVIKPLLKIVIILTIPTLIIEERHRNPTEPSGDYSPPLEDRI